MGHFFQSKIDQLVRHVISIVIHSVIFKVFFERIALLPITLVIIMPWQAVSLQLIEDIKLFLHN